ncbi:hypothetical protein IEQ34_003869 [Dendrobium chrysotoxum]|uniref:Uncharacterized protein n=1 Tax=Dendrobium chrysotoxum TaxID=161865 RepID=A0AAV7HCJ5_DENCH|nr:hypothetical protein IEQ34_003869 [Dendrobium chrysotoxum]
MESKLLTALEMLCDWNGEDGKWKEELSSAKPLRQVCWLARAALSQVRGANHGGAELRVWRLIAGKCWVNGCFCSGGKE